MNIGIKNANVSAAMNSFVRKYRMTFYNSKVSSVIATGVERLLLLLFALTILCIIGSAQNSTLDGTTPLALAPGSPAGSSSFNGNLNFRLPLIRAGGRGSAQYTLTLPFHQQWHVKSFVDEPTGQEYHFPVMGPWGVQPGYGPGILHYRTEWDFVNRLTCSAFPDYYVYPALTRFTFIMPDGTEYELVDTKTNGAPSTPECDFSYGDRGTVFVTNDGSSATFIADSAIWDLGGSFSQSGFLVLKDGTRYRIDNELVTWMRDRNGNRLSFIYDESKRVTRVTDSLNRNIDISYANMTNILYDQITFKRAGGAARTIRIWYNDRRNVLRHTQPSDPSSVMTYDDLFPGFPFWYYLYMEGVHDGKVVSSVELPDNRSYQFYYNVYGELARVVLPTGGAIEYDYTAGSGLILGSRPGWGRAIAL
jgi:hypothetical protein